MIRILLIRLIIYHAGSRLHKNFYRMKKKRFILVFSGLFTLLLMVTIGCSNKDDEKGTVFILPEKYAYDYSPDLAPSFDNGLSMVSPSEFIYRDIPANKKVTVYLLNEDGMDALGSYDEFESVESFSGKTKTGETSVKFKIPDQYVGEYFYPIVLIVLNDNYLDFSFEGKTLTDFLSLDVESDDMVIGLLKDADDVSYVPQSFEVPEEGGKVEFVLWDLRFLRNMFIR